MEEKTKHVIVVADVLECLKKIPDESVQLIIADPPYNIDIAEWDCYEDYIVWASEWIKEAYRVLKKNGNIVIFGGFQFQNTGRADLLELVHYIRNNTKFKLVNVIIWYYKNGISARRFFSNRHEEIMWFAKTNKYIFNLDDIRIKYDKETLALYKKDKRLKEENLIKGKNPTNVWEISRLNSNSLERVGHPTQKPEAVIERIVKSMSLEGEIVFDLFAGSAITMKVCIENGRHSIGCDVDSSVVDYAEKQLRKIQGNGYNICNSIEDFIRYIEIEKNK